MAAHRTESRTSRWPLRHRAGSAPEAEAVASPTRTTTARRGGISAWYPLLICVAVLLQPFTRYAIHPLEAGRVAVIVVAVGLAPWSPVGWSPARTAGLPSPPWP